MSESIEATTTDSPLQHQAQDAEGLRAALVNALDGHTRHSRDCHLSGEFLASRVWPIIARALSASPPQAETPGLDREAVARIIDPETWERWDRHQDRCLKNGDVPDGAKASADRQYGCYTKISLAKADAILAATAVSQPPTTRHGAGELTEDDVRRRAARTVLDCGWKPGDKMSFHSVEQLLIRFGLSLAKNPPDRCAYPECGCDHDATCGDAPPTTRHGAEDVEALRTLRDETNRLRERYLSSRDNADWLPYLNADRTFDDAAIAYVRTHVLPAQPGPAPVGEGDAIEALRAVRDRIINPVYGGIDDTFWMSPTETVVDFIDATLAALNNIPAAGGNTFY